VLFSGAIAVTDSVTGRQPMSICRAGRTVILNENQYADPSFDPWESRRLEE
jgi:hypothetical protein